MLCHKIIKQFKQFISNSFVFDANVTLDFLHIKKDKVNYLQFAL